MIKLTTNNFKGMTIKSVKKVLRDERNIQFSEWSKYKDFYYVTVGMSHKGDRVAYFEVDDNIITKVKLYWV